ncbi:hypothetical protein HPL003_14435 [Paenibacillus terrae HPL-003]|uniref:Uncharacterized protein n=1 Tax=Paenibacillus terrae (strain HPL-003) TaxID=985665 RepID=G7W254_PAETH|nr:hypothetical protein [Paenibacillus terrae]AET59638.1 hypothetical protein HPL003_14435 [Paenibacillus terrae HPL-003]
MMRIEKEDYDQNAEIILGKLKAYNDQNMPHITNYENKKVNYAAKDDHGEFLGGL